MDILQDKTSSINNNNIINNNNNPIKSLKEPASGVEIGEGFSSSNNNNNAHEHSPISVSPTISETIYEFGSHFENPSHVVSEKVQNLASQIYNELQKIMNRCNDDEESVGGLMPLIVTVLESLDLALIENQQLQVDLELCKDDNEQLVSAFEKEKQSKKKIEQRLFEFEFATEEEKTHYQQRIDSLANIVKMLELKAKNASDHSSRMEEKENERKKEYMKLHDRYTELLRSHRDLMERVKIMFADDGSNNLSSINFTNFVGTLKANLHRLSLSEDGGGPGSELQFIEPTELQPALVPPDSIVKSSNHQTWNLETEMSYDDTTTICEDVEDLQRDKDKDLRDRDASLSGMEKEIENLITENNELLATKNALNIVKDDLIAKVDELQSELAMCKNEIQQREAVQERLKSRIAQIEDELKKNKEELEETKQKLSSMKEDDEEGVPIAQRKRFTRVEMSRVLMERNTYKEKYFDLQDRLRWAELSRATKNEDKRSAIWKFFSNFFNPANPSPTSAGFAATTSGDSAAVPSIRYSANPTTPALEAMRRKARAQQNGDLVLMMDSDLSSERARAMKNLKAHVTRLSNGDRIQAYGWSITGQSSNSSSSESSKSSSKNTSVPVPIYCRPLGGEDIGMKIWCATAVDLSGGEAGFPLASDSKPNSDSLSALENEINEALREQSSSAHNDQNYSTFVWICSVSHSKSKVTIVNIRSNPGEVLDSFFLKTHLLCITSVPGAKTTDFLGDSGITIDENSPELKLSQRKEAKESQLKECDAASSSLNSSISFSTVASENPEASNQTSEAGSPIQSDADSKLDESIKSKSQEDLTIVSNASSVLGSLPLSVPARSVTLEKLSEYVAYTEPPSPTTSMQDASSETKQVPTPAAPVEPMSTRLPTMWLGGQNGCLYVHSGLAQWSHCIATIHLPDSILHIIHYRGRVFVALANGQCCIFYRSEQTGEWNFDHYYTLDIGIYSTISSDTTSQTSTDSKASSNCQTALYSIRCLEVSKETVWMGYRNLIFIINTRSLKVIHSFVAHPRKETYVRQLTGHGDGVWCSFRLDSTLRLYCAFKPYQHIQNIDIEQYVSKMVMPKSFNFVRITALRASNHRLWIGTSNGVVLCLPCVRPSESSQESQNQANKKLTTTASTGSLTLSTFMPLCDVTTTQVSFHGHKDNVKFFVCTDNLILSGGEGYVDFRINDTDDTGASLSKGDKSHLIVWELTSLFSSTTTTTS